MNANYFLWLNDLEYDVWDREMEQDFSFGGRGGALLEKVQQEIAEGHAISFEKLSLLPL